MPISSPASYLPTTNEFIAHWTAADAALGGGGPMVLKGGVNLAALVALRDNLSNQRSEVEAARNAVEGTRADLELAKRAMLDRLNQFNRKLRSVADGTNWTAMMPKAFSISDGMGAVIQPLDDVLDLWLHYEAAAGAFTLMGGYARATFAADLSALRGLYTGCGSALNSLQLARAVRNDTQDAIYQVLKHYRQRIPAEFADGSPIFVTLPRLTPKPGSTPDAVTLSAAYNTATQQAELSWSAVADARVVSLELRGVAGASYHARDESVIATLPAGAPAAFSTDFALGVPGTVATFKIYTITALGHERGSKAATVKRT